jgi:nucleobase:cation symporter-1, NCS1 family
MADTQQDINSEVTFGFLPVLKKDRIFGWWDFLLIQAGFGIAAWCFLVGGLTGTVLEGKYAIWVILLGNALPVLLILPFALQTARQGVDTFIAANQALGRRFSQVFFLIFAILNLGWITIACFMLGLSAIKVSDVIGLPAFLTTDTQGAPIYAITFFILSMYIAYKGPVTIKRLARIGVPAVILILFGLIIVVLFKYGMTKVLSSAPAEPYDTLRDSVFHSLEWNVGLGFSWLVYLGQWCRMARNESGAINGTYLGYGLVLNVAGIFGAFTALLVGSLDPTDWMIAAGGMWFGMFGLILLILANLTSSVVLMYSQAISVKTMLPRIRWHWCVLTVVPAALLMLSPTFYDSYQKFLLYVAFIMATFGGVLVTDWFFVRHQRADVGALYDQGNPQYRYWAGWNPAAVLAVALGSLFYWWMYNPVTDVSGPLFPFLGAGIPAFFVAGAIYYAAAKTIFAGQYKSDREWQRRVAGGETDAVVLLPGPEPALSGAGPAVVKTGISTPVDE